MGVIAWDDDDPRRLPFALLSPTLTPTPLPWGEGLWAVVLPAERLPLQIERHSANQVLDSSQVFDTSTHSLPFSVDDFSASRCLRICASTAAIAVMFITRREVALVVRMCTGLEMPIRIGPIATPSVNTRTRL